MDSETRSLKQIISTLEGNRPDDIAIKWRKQVFEQLMRNEQLKILHQQEMRQIQDREEDLKIAVETAQKQFQQASSSALSTKKTMSQLYILPQALQCHFDSFYDVMSTIDAQQKRLAFVQSRLKTIHVLKQRERNSQSKRLEDALNDISRLQEQLLGSQNSSVELDYTKKQLNQAKEKIAELSGEVERAKVNMQDEIATAGSNYEAHIASLNEKLNAAQAENATLNAKLVESQETVTKQVGDLEGARALRTQLEILTDTLLAEKDTSAKLRAQVEDLKAKLDNTVSQENIRANALTKIEETYENKISRLNSDKESELGQLNSSHAAVIAELNQDHQQAIQDLKADFEKQLVSQDEKYKNTSSDSEQALADAQAQVTRLETQIRELHNEAESERETSQNKLGKLETQLKELKREREALLSALNEQSKRIGLDEATQTVEPEVQTRRFASVRTTSVQQRLDSLEELSSQLLDDF